MITDEKAEQAIRYLAGTDEESAVASVEVKRLEDEIKAIEAAIILRVEGSVAIRESIARTDASTIAARNKYYIALLNSERLYNKRRTAERITELWRTCASNKRHGIV